MSQQCKEDVREPGMWPKYHQCTRKAWKDGYCKQHHPDSVAERRRKSAENFRAKSGAAIQANLKKQIAELEQENKALAAQQSIASDRIAELQKALVKAFDAIHSLPVDALGIVPETHDCPAYPIRDQLLHDMVPLIREHIHNKTDTDQSPDSSPTDCGEGE